MLVYAFFYFLPLEHCRFGQDKLRIHGQIQRWEGGGQWFWYPLSPSKSRSHTFVEIDHEIISILPSTDSRRVVVSMCKKYWLTA